jgi:hypothetical protein
MACSRRLPFPLPFDLQAFHPLVEAVPRYPRQATFYLLAPGPVQRLPEQALVDRVLGDRVLGDLERFVLARYPEHGKVDTGQARAANAVMAFTELDDRFPAIDHTP